MQATTETEKDAEPKPTTADPADWLRVPAASKRLGAKERTLYRLARERRIPFRRLPGTQTIAFAPEDIQAIARMSEVRPLQAA